MDEKQLQALANELGRNVRAKPSLNRSILGQG
ncbi:Uncharacterised protein [Plesiomonas shigelloides]|nr:Uncharacterised protein [Plesiomonas shigelloides]